MRMHAAYLLSFIALALAGCEGPNAAVTATQPKSADKSEPDQNGKTNATPAAPNRLAQSPASQPSSAPATTSQPSAEPKSNIDSENEKLPPYIRILEASAPGPVRIDVSVDGSQRITLKTTNVAKFRITRKDSPLATDRSVALHIDSVNFEWTRTRQTLILQRTPTGDWLSEEEVEKKP